MPLAMHPFPRLAEIAGAMMAITLVAVVSSGFALCRWATADEGSAAPILGASERRVARHVKTLAADEMRGRSSGTPGYDRAGTYVETELMRIGVEPLFGESYRQPFVIRMRQVDRDGYVELQRPSGKTVLPFLKGAAFLHPSGRLAVEGNDKRLVYVGLGIAEPEAGWDDYAGVDVSDACVVVVYETPRHLAKDLPEAVWRLYQDADAGAERKIRAMVEAGSRCAVLISAGGAAFDFEAFLSDPRVLRRMELVDAAGRLSLPDVIGFGLNRRAAELLFEGQRYPAFPGGRPQPFVLRDVTIGYHGTVKPVEPDQETRTFNLGALVPGTDATKSTELIVLSAHLDGQGMQGAQVLNSANDNAAAVAALIEAARLLVDQPVRRPIAFLFPAAEEIGLLGAMYFARQPPVPLEQIALNVNMEMVGTPRKSRGRHRFRVTGTLTRDLEAVVDEIEARHAGVVFDYALKIEGPDPPFRRADHVNFFLRGIPTIYYYGGNDSNYHQPSDDAREVDMHKVATMADLLVTTVRTLDEREQLPRPDANLLN